MRQVDGKMGTIPYVTITIKWVSDSAINLLKTIKTASFEKKMFFQKTINPKRARRLWSQNGEEGRVSELILRNFNNLDTIVPTPSFFYMMPLKEYHIPHGHIPVNRNLLSAKYPKMFFLFESFTKRRNLS